MQGRRKNQSQFEVSVIVANGNYRSRANCGNSHHTRPLPHNTDDLHLPALWRRQASAPGSNAERKVVHNHPATPQSRRSAAVSSAEYPCPPLPHQLLADAVES